MTVTEQLKEKYPQYIINDVRNRIAQDESDTSMDDKILRMSPSQVFAHVVAWNGLLGGYDNTIKDWIHSVYGVDLDEVSEKS